MSKDILGFPLEYEVLPELFDLHNISDDTEKKNLIIKKLLDKYHVNSVIDFTCGTGSQVFYLNKFGYKIIGNDISYKLIEIACEKAKRQNLDIRFEVGDIRSKYLGDFDAAIAMFNAIGHLTKEDFKFALENVKRNLNSKGIFVFDIFNAEVINADNVGNLKMDYKKQGEGFEIHHIQHSEINKARGVLTSHDDLTVYKNGEAKNYKNSFSLQIYTAKELNSILESNGFKIIEQLDIAGKNFINNQSPNILTVAQLST